MSSVDAPKNKKGKGILIIIFLLLLILLILIGGYLYFIKYIQETPKQLFFRHVGQNNLSNIIDTDIYYTIFEKINTESHKTETIANITTSMKNDLTKNVDVSKLEFILNTTSDKENEAAIVDAKINYLSNDIFHAKLISTKDNIAIGSNEILDKYIATTKVEFANSINRSTGLETDLSADFIDEKIDKYTENKIVIDEEYKAQKVNEYSKIIFDAIPEEAVTEKENVVVTIDGKTINTKAYTLNLDVNAYKQVLSNVLNTLKNDEELLTRLVTGNATQNNIEVEEPAENTTTTINPLPNVQVEYTGGETEEHQTAREIETESLEIVKDFPDENLVKNENIVDETSEENNSKLFKNLISALVLKQKIETKKEDLLKDIVTEIKNINNLNEGLQITVYVRNEEEQPEKTIKLVSELPNNINVDIEYQEENKIKITYLEEVEENEEVITKGISTEMKRVASDVKTEFNIQIGEIVDKKVIAKTQIDLETEGSKSSKTYENDIIVKYNNSEGDFKLNIKNNIDFENVKVEETLNDENSIFIDKLIDEEVKNLYTQVVEKIMQVYAEKIFNLAFIDNNLSSSIVQQPNIEPINEEEKNTVRQKLIETVSNMMGQAQLNGETFTIQNLKNIQIEGYNVSSIVTEELATVKINGYTFMIDKDFILSE